jgi:FkbM family methyltransferase
MSEVMPLRRRAKYWLYHSVPGFAGRFRYYGTRVHFPPGAPLFRALCENGSFEPEIVERLVAFARPHTTVFDVGANVGLMAIPVLRACDSCRVVSFEPSPNSLPYLQRTAAGSLFGDRWVIVGKALSRQPGELDFTIGSPADALFEGFKSGARIANATTIRVPVSTLDAEWQALGRPPVSMLKIDVEGAEAEVLEGGRELLRAARPAILLEWYAPYLAHYGVGADWLIQFARDCRLRLFGVPSAVEAEDAQALDVLMMTCQNFLLLPSS